MGIIYSAIAIPTALIKKARNKRKALKTKTTSGRTAATTTTPQPLSPTQADAVEGLQNEHLATSPPPVIGQQEGGGIAQRLGGETPLHSTYSNTKADQSAIINTTEESGNKGRDKMASDEDYAAFLDKANQDPNEGVTKTQSSGKKVVLKATDQGVSIPEVLWKVTKDAFYVSDADEPFEPVCLKLKGKGLPDEAGFAKLVNHPSPTDAGVEILDIGDWDSQGQYEDIVEATREATKGSDVRVFRISRGGSRIEYWVVGVSDGTLLGVRALAIES